MRSKSCYAIIRIFTSSCALCTLRDAKGNGKEAQGQLIQRVRHAGEGEEGEKNDERVRREVEIELEVEDERQCVYN